MKKLFIYIILIGLLACEKDQVLRNPNLGELRFTYAINMNLAAYNSLKIPMNTVFVPYGGIKGFFVTYTGSTYYAWEAACPNHAVNTCQRLSCAKRNNNTFEACQDPYTHDYIFVQCPCDHTVYNLVNGAAISTSLPNVYPLLNYSVSVSGNILTISN
ncbi:hypothetical protein [Capnocytophaga sp. oral taxon 878]|uniref:hypothetical protein n=1 Tax=Capnocytophaga sp. oral taxon 878 TaxID=1316596 RepID=UPI000D0255A7|nr:hypothetical protein [Capnocytophaga sp. oral taxon 878]AVM49825.1 hypothetical protein C4H12_04735 [Capnocytophaga sp. oral taxon 878]